MKRVTGIGGIFFKGRNAEQLRTWYREHLGIEADGDSGATFEWREADHPEQLGQTVWSIFAGHTKYFEPSSSAFMIASRISTRCSRNFAAKVSRSMSASKNTNTGGSPG